MYATGRGLQKTMPWASKGTECPQISPSVLTLGDPTHVDPYSCGFPGLCVGPASDILIILFCLMVGKRGWFSRIDIVLN